MNKSRSLLASIGNNCNGIYNIFMTPFGKYRSTFSVSIRSFWFRPLYLPDISMSLGLWEPFVQYELKRLLNSNTTFIDIGAYIGFYTVLASPLAKNVISFEPDRTTFKTLKKNCIGLANVMPYREAVGCKEGNVYLQHSMQPSANQVTETWGEGCDVVHCVTLDSIINNP